MVGPDYRCKSHDRVPAPFVVCSARPDEIRGEADIAIVATWARTPVIAPLPTTNRQEPNDASEDVGAYFF